MSFTSSHYLPDVAHIKIKLDKDIEVIKTQLQTLSTGDDVSELQTKINAIEEKQAVFAQVISNLYNSFYFGGVD